MVSADYVNRFGGKINTIKSNTKALLSAINDTGLEVSIEYIRAFANASCRRHLQDGRRSQERNEHEGGENQIPCYLLHAGFLLGLFFDSEDGSNKFLRNID
jgi:hypothetical protein